jgi:hypothetical protein
VFAVAAVDQPQVRAPIPKFANYRGYL